jgi:hypothetical protein
VLLGGDIDNGNPSFLLNGRIDEAAIYNRALSSNEVAAIYNAGPAGKGFPPLVLRASVQGPLLTIAFDGYPGKTYSVQYATDLNAGAWSVLTNITALNTNVSCSDTISNSSRRWYRVTTGN